VGDPSIIEELEGIAPVHAVRGNTDHGPTADRLPLDAVVDLPLDGGGRLRAYIRHIREDIDLDPSAADIDLVVTGHTHRPLVERIDGVTWLNPGSCGPRRFDLPITVALIRVDGEGRAGAPEILHLPT
jgi:putative phosphoesterase